MSQPPCGTPLRLNRVERLVGADGIDALSAARVIIFGVGGVGGWTAEALVRSGVNHLTIVDPDRVAESNINRQPMATMSSIGTLKVDTLGARLRDINPNLDLTTIAGRYDATTAAQFPLDQYDYVIDAIDSLADKALLILNATSTRGVTLFSSMGAALKSDPTRVEVAEFWKVTGCPLAAALRRRFKKSGMMPRRKFKAVFSPQLLTNHPTAEDTSGAMSFNKVAVNGALVAVTATFGMTLASLVIRHATGV